MRRRIRLSESDLHRIIKESVKRILREEDGHTSNNGSDFPKHEYKRKGRAKDEIEKAIDDWANNDAPKLAYDIWKKSKR